MEYGGLLKAARERSGISQEEMAHQMNMTQSNISKYENNYKEPPLTMFKQWMENTSCQDVAIAFLMGVDGMQMMGQVMEALSSVVGFVSIIF
ncbi:helix-turn-helix domain-containing protein [Salicibibacter kimchii]|uniref:helix-turn-helix domain-containing protein n=1 Tax=Salicibibacter kimchii TaxID=2099786 RepID=UPI00135B0E54|nr:helix-turn-helix transcriptional regulator [Salicibibacter kimchii]